MEVDAASPSDESYTVIASGVSFNLTRAQLEVDSPSYFTSAFQTEGFSDSVSRTLKIDKDPLLFKYITLYLSGYKILPLQLAAIPITMSLDSALDNLLIDANYFGLDGLIAQIELSKNPPRSTSLAEQLGYHSTIIDFADLLSGAIVLEIRPSQTSPADDETEVFRIQIRGEPDISSKVVIRMSGVEIMVKSSNQGFGIRTAEGHLDSLSDLNDWGIYAQLNYTYQSNSDQSITFKYLQHDSTVSSPTSADFEIDLGKADPGGLIEIDGTIGTIQQLSQHFRSPSEGYSRTLSISPYEVYTEKRFQAQDTFNTLKELVKYSDYSSATGPTMSDSHEQYELDLVATELYVTCNYRLSNDHMAPFTYLSSKCLTRSTALRNAFH